MTGALTRALSTLAVFAALALVLPLAAAGDVTTAGYGNLRDNWDANEPGLSPAAVQSGSFGQLFSTTLEGSVYAQPLVYGGDVIVTTEKAKAYAINAQTGAIVWQRSFGTPFTSAAIGCSDLTPNLGSTSTPVIDPTAGTIYLTTRLTEGGKATADSHWYLQAVSAATGAERAGFPVRITGTPYNTPGVEFNEHFEQQRPALLLLGGVVYIAFASDCDITPYRGIVVGVNGSSGAITTMWSDESGAGSDESSQSGIWQSGGGLVSDAPGRIILTTGNGVSPQPAPSTSPPATLSESVLALGVGGEGKITPTDFFAPSNAPELDAGDTDLGSGGPIALPPEYFGTASVPHLVVQVGKDGRIFLINADSMGGYRQGAGKGDAVLQTVGPYGGVWGHPAAYGGQGGWVYVLESAGGGFLRALSYGVNGSGLPALSSQATSSQSFGYTSGSPLVTSSGTTAGSAVVWVEHVSGPGGSGGQLRAYAAAPSSGTLPLLWTGRIGTASKFATPTAYEGRVYVGTRSGKLLAFGDAAGAPLQAPPVELAAAPVGGSSSTPVTVSANREATVTGPVTMSGEQGLTETQQPTHLTPQAPTSGPHAIPPPGTTTLGPGVISVEQPPVGAAIQAGARLRLRVRFRPKRPGPIVALLVIHTSLGTRTVTVSGYGTHPGLGVSARPLDFGEIRTNAEGATLSMQLSNTWTRSERITGLRLPAGPFRVLGLPAIGTTLAPRAEVTVSVKFDPGHAGRYRSSLVVATDRGSLSLPVSGGAQTGVPRLAVSAPTIDFGRVRVGASVSRTFHVRDSGNVPLTISRAIAPGEPFEAPVPLSEGVTIEPHVEATVTVTLKPAQRGPARGTYVLGGEGVAGYTRVTLSGEGV